MVDKLSPRMGRAECLDPGPLSVDRTAPATDSTGGLAQLPPRGYLAIAPAADRAPRDQVHRPWTRAWTRPVRLVDLVG